jgi:hypothetical protein
MKKFLGLMTTAILTCIAITCITTGFITWDSLGQTKTSIASAQVTSGCPANSAQQCLDINVYESLNLMPREDRKLLNAELGAQYGGSSSPPNPLVIKPGESVNFFIGTQYFLPASYNGADGIKYVPHVGAGKMWPVYYPNSSNPIYTNNKLTFNSGDVSNPQQVVKEFGHAGTTDDPPSPTSAQYLIASGSMTYNNPGEFVATARLQMIRHFWTNCSPANWYFVPNTGDLCTGGQSQGRHSSATEDKMIDITVSRLIKVARPLTAIPLPKPTLSN